MKDSALKNMVSVIMPSYNEPALADTVGQVQAVLHRLNRPYEIIVVDDASTEYPASNIPRSDEIRVYRSHVNRGYGASLKEGIRLARGDVVLMMDADGQHRPSDFARFLEKMGQGADAVLGSRQKVVHSHLWRLPGKWLINKIAGYLVARKIPDLNCGFRAIRTELIRRYMRLCPNGFSFSTTTTLILLSERRAVVFLPLDVENRIGKSTVRIQDGLEALLGLLRTIMLFAPLRVLLPPSLFLLATGTCFLIWDIIRINITQATILLLTTGMMLLFFGLVADQVASLRKEML